MCAHVALEPLHPVLCGTRRCGDDDDDELRKGHKGADLVEDVVVKELLDVGGTVVTPQSSKEGSKGLWRIGTVSRVRCKLTPLS